jgi:molybdenum cofactor cytidylyltransferase
LEAVVLAAGAASRFGGGKLLAPFKGGVLLDAALAVALAAPVRSVTVVWGADRRVPEAARAFAARTGQAERMRLTFCERAAEGMSQSLKSAIRALPTDTAGLFVFLGDMPRTPVSVLGPLAAALAAGALAAAPVFCGRRGHPALFAASLFPRLLQVDGDSGGSSVLATLGAKLTLVPACDDGVLFDVDRPGDLMS